MNGYELTRMWYDFKFENPDLVKHIHSDLFFYIVDRWNRLGQKEKIGLPTSFTMEAVGINSYNTYKKALNDLIKFGFIKSVLDSKNQHQSRVIALSFFDKAKYRALDEAMNKATDKSLDTIIEEKNKGKEEEKNNLKLDIISNPFDISLPTEILESYPFEDFWMMYGKKVGKDKCIQKWKKIDSKSKAIIFETLPSYVLSTPDNKYRLNPSTYLNGKHWEDEIIFSNETVNQIKNEQVNQNLLSIIAANPGIY